MTRVMVEIEGEWDTVLTYEIDGPAKVGDLVAAPLLDEVLPGRVVALGSRPWRRRNGTIQPPYWGPCKTATVITGGPDATS